MPLTAFTTPGAGHGPSQSLWERISTRDQDRKGQLWKQHPTSLAENYAPFCV